MIFQLKKYLTLLYVFFISKVNPWKKINGIYLPVKLDIGFNTLRWILNGQYEEGEIEIVKKFIEHNDVVLEIGTGLGYVSAFCAAHIGSQNVNTYEANPNNFLEAIKVFKKNNISPLAHNSLLSDTKGVTSFAVNNKSRLASSLNIQTNNTISIETEVLNDVIHDLKPTFLIMDIEGAEYDIFKIINFQSITKIQFELHPLILKEEKCKEIFDILARNNFVREFETSDARNYFFRKTTRV